MEESRRMSLFFSINNYTIFVQKKLFLLTCLNFDVYEIDTYVDNKLLFVYELGCYNVVSKTCDFISPKGSSHDYMSYKIYSILCFKLDNNE